MKETFVLVVAVGLMCRCLVFGTTLYVSPYGCDTNPGTRAEPKATMKGAFVAVVDYKATNGLPEGGLVVYFREGRYPFNSTLAAGPEISGEPGRPVIFKAYGDEEVIFDGSKLLQGSRFSLVSDSSVLERLGAGAKGNVYECVIDEVSLRDALSNGTAILHLDGKMSQVSRFPNVGFAHIDRVIDEGSVYAHGRTIGDPPAFDMENPIGAEIVLLEPDAGMMAKWEREYEKTQKARLTGYISNDWYRESHRIASVTGDAIKLLGYSRYSVGGRGAKRCFITNLMSELDSPGEWYFDETAGKLYVWPYQPITTETEIGVWAGPEFLAIRCSYVTFQGFTIQGTTLGSRGSGMVTFYEGNHTKFKGCTFRNTLRSAVAFVRETESTNSGIIGCDIYDANNSLNLDGGIANADEIIDGGNFAINCHFTQRYSHGFTGRINVRGVGNVFRNNLIHNLPDDPIAGAGGGVANLVELNEIFNCGVERGDGGAMYWTRAMHSYGNVIRDNFLHHLISPPGLHTRAGLYADQLDAGDTYEQNVFYKVAHRAILLNGGAAHRAERNVFLKGHIGIYQTEGFAQVAYDAKSKYDDGTLRRGDVRDFVWRAEQVVGPEGWNEDPWLSRFPTFALVMNQEKMRFWPIETYFIGNLFYGNTGSNFLYRYSSGRDNVTTNIDSTPDYIHKRENREIDLDLFVDPSSLNFSFIEDAPAWTPDIPFEKIGLYIGDGRSEMPDKDHYRSRIREHFSGRASFVQATYDPGSVDDSLYFNSGELLMDLTPMVTEN